MSHSLCICSGDDVTVKCQWIMDSGNCDASAWKVVSNSLDINFIHDDISIRMCMQFIWLVVRCRVPSHKWNRWEKSVKFQSKYQICIAMQLKMSPSKRRPFCSSLNVLHFFRPLASDESEMPFILKWIHIYYKQACHCSQFWHSIFGSIDLDRMSYFSHGKTLRGWFVQLILRLILSRDHNEYTGNKQQYWNYSK